MASQANSDFAFSTSYITLPHKPTAKIAYRFVPSKPSATTPTEPHPLLIFLPGLGSSQRSYYPVINHRSSLTTHPAVLTYDRYGQGATSDRDPMDANATDSKHGHTVADAVKDLHNSINSISALHYLTSDYNSPLIIFIANSIGCAIARLYAESYPDHVSGLVLLDSILANSDFVSIFPDPDVDTFDSSQLPEGITVSDIVETRQIVHRIFHPSQGSAEGLSRKNLASLLPSSDGPRLVTGLKKFAEDSFKATGIPIAVTNQYVHPYWHEYNVGLTKITSLDRARGPIIAENAGHFIQKDDPELVFEEVKIMLECMSVDGF